MIVSPLLSLNPGLNSQVRNGYKRTHKIREFVEVAYFLGGVLPKGNGVVMLLRLYADESLDDATGIFRIAGYLMTHRQWKSVDVKICKALGALEWFHMKDGDHRKHPQTYNKLLRTITPKSVVAGFSVSVNKNEYDVMLSERLGKTAAQILDG